MAGKSRREKFVRVMSGQARGPGAAFLRGGAWLASGLYRQAMAARNALYDCGLKRQTRLGRAAVSVGNLSVGGTGKTVLAAEMADWLRGEVTPGGGARRPRVAILMRGYRGERSPAGSDEAALLRERLGDVIVGAGANRVAAARRLLAGANPPDVFILDDGFQHRRVHRDLNVVAIDATADPDGPLARLLPRGLMREPFAALRRADFAIITHADLAPAGRVERLCELIAKAKPGLTVLRCRHAASHLTCGPEAKPLTELGGRPFLAFCGIGNPESFRGTAAALPGLCLEVVAYDDHQVYRSGDLAALAERGRTLGAELLLTTGKDYVKLTGLAEALALPVWAVQVGIEWLDDPATLRQAIGKLI